MKKRLSVLVMIIILCTIMSSFVYGANVYYKKYDKKNKEYLLASKRVPRCSAWASSLWDDDEIRFDHFWIHIKTKKATYKKKGLIVYECDECHSRKYVKTIKIKKAEALVKRYLTAAKKYQVGKMNKCFKKKSKTYVLETDKRMRKVYKRVNKKIKWKITNATGNKKKCTVNARVKIPNLYNAAFYSAYDAYWYYYNHDGATYKQMDNHYYKKYVKWAKQYKGKTKTRHIKFKLVKTNGKWKIAKATRSVIDVANALANEAEEKAFKKYWSDPEYEY